MRDRHLPPMAGGSDHDVVCIETRKVFDFCFQEHRVERTFNNIDFPVGDVTNGMRPIIDCEIVEEEIRCREVSRRKEIEGHKKGKVLVCVAIEVPIRLRVVDFDGERVFTTITQRVVFLKQAVLCAPEGTDIQCQVTGNCCCFFDQENNQITCTFDFCVVLSATAIVRVLVPTLGFCAPQECRSVTTGCPPFVFKDVDCDKFDKKRFFHRDFDKDFDRRRRDHDRDFDKDFDRRRKDHDRDFDKDFDRKRRDHDRDFDKDFDRKRRDHDRDCDRDHDDKKDHCD